MVGIVVVNMITVSAWTMDDVFLFVVGTFYVSTVFKYRQCWFGNFFKATFGIFLGDLPPAPWMFFF